MLAAIKKNDNLNEELEDAGFELDFEDIGVKEGDSDGNSENLELKKGESD